MPKSDVKTMSARLYGALTSVQALTEVLKIAVKTHPEPINIQPI